jgi:hypothetical protein
LIEGSDKDVLAAEDRITSSRIALDRLDAAAVTLADRLADAESREAADAESREAADALDRERDEVEKLAAALAARIKREYPPHAAALCSLLSALAAGEDRVAAVNGKLARAGRTDGVEGVEVRVISPGGNLPELVSLAVLTSLRPLGACPGWGTARSTAETLGLPTEI